MKLNNLFENDVQKIHEASLYVLKNVGVEFKSKEAVEIFKKHGAKVEGAKVYIGEKLFNKIISNIPESFVLLGRETNKDIIIGWKNQIYAPAYGPVYVRDGDERRYATGEDFINFTKLSDSSSLLNIINPNITEPNDVPTKKRWSYQMANCLKHTTKPLMGKTLGKEVSEKCIDFVSEFYGNKEKNLLLGLISPVSPLMYDSTMIEAIFAYAENEQPLLFTSCSLPGATSPVSLYGSVVVNNAELLAGIILSQLIKPGLPVIYGITTSSCDLRYVSPAIGSAETGILVNITSALSKYYGIPCRSGGGLSDSKIVDVQAGIESTLILLSSVLSEIDFVMHACGILESFNSICYEKFIVDEEIIRIAKRFSAGLNIDEELLGLETIKKLGSGGHYLEEMHTIKNFRKEHYVPKLFSREGYDAWGKYGSQTVNEKARNEIKNRLNNYEMPEISKEQEKVLLKYCN
jgi:trimethylamine--corrinoid protein Co-methyltransferase